jgi:2-polyprenyl-3-methyl-5-hydroxy-6-metoxy-1,4-benzoquinol methylase
MHMQPCTVCRSHFSRTVYTVKNPLTDSPISHLFINKCSQCGNVFLGNSPHTFQDALYDYYALRSPIHPLSSLSQATKTSYDRVFRAFSHYIKPVSILDVGCGTGEFVAYGNSRGVNVSGIDLSSSAVSIAQSFHLPVHLNSLDRLPHYLSYDVITLFEVLEHVERPCELIQQACDRLQIGGLLYITTPNYSSLDRFFFGPRWRVFHPEHITYFSTQQLLRLIPTCDPRFEILNYQSNNFDVQIFQYFFSLFNSIFSKIRLLPSPADQDHSSLSSASHNYSIREHSDTNQYLRFLKSLINRFLTTFSLGSTSILLLRRTY